MKLISTQKRSLKCDPIPAKRAHTELLEALVQPTLVGTDFHSINWKNYSGEPKPISDRHDEKDPELLKNDFLSLSRAPFKSQQHECPRVGLREWYFISSTSFRWFSQIYGRTWAYVDVRSTMPLCHPKNWYSREDKISASKCVMISLRVWFLNNVDEEEEGISGKRSMVPIKLLRTQIGRQKRTSHTHYHEYVALHRNFQQPRPFPEASEMEATIMFVQQRKIWQSL